MCLSPLQEQPDGGGVPGGAGPGLLRAAEVGGEVPGAGGLPALQDGGVPSQGVH